jgi:membrane protein DedA with SNARE-associated domain
VRELLGDLLSRLVAAPDLVVYLVLGVMAALENIVPPVPADVIVLFGGLLAGRGRLDPWTVFFVVWSANVFGALLVYGVGRRYGPGFFAGRVGGMLLRPRQVVALGSFYQRFGFSVIFLSRFLPMFRAVVPAFAGISRVGFLRTAVPIAAASAIWYGTIVYVGVTFGSNWNAILARLQESGRWTGAIAGIALVAVAVWWWRSRRDIEEDR